MWDAHVGQLVVCVDPNPQWEESKAEGWNVPERGRVYRVSAVEPGYQDSEIIALQLDEVRNRIATSWGAEPNFWKDRFRPVNTQIIDNLLKVEENA